MRKLATIRRISELLPIENADRIELAIIDGWQCVVKKGEFKVNDLVVYIEIDSVVPDHEVFEFMRTRKFRVRTIKLRKQISQGLVIPLEELDKFKPDYSHKVVEGDEVTEVLGIIKYDPEAIKEQKYNAKNAKPLNPVVDYLMSFGWFRKIRYLLGFKRLKNFPHFLSKTDETRVQNLPRVGKIYNGVEVYMSEKLDGQSASYAIYKESKLFFKRNFYVCSRNLALHKKNNSTWWTIADKLNIEYRLRKLGMNIAIQGEIIGEGVQGNKYGIKGLDFYVFNVVELDNNRYYTLKEKEEFCKKYNFKHIPVLGTFVINEDMTPKDFVGMADGKSVFGETLREGLVFRSIKDDRQSFKAISNEFLIKHGE